MKTRMAYKRKYGSYNKKKTVRRRYKKSSTTSRRRLLKLIRTTVKKTAEPKTKNVNFAKGEMYHNAFYAPGGSPPSGYLAHLNDAALMPTQGVGDNQRIGDQIYLTSIKLKMLIGQKGDRPNVNFRYYVLSVPKGSSITYNNWFTNVTGNILLDDPNKDFVKVHKSGFWRPNEAGLAATGNDEYTFAKRITFPYKKLLKFGPADGATTHNDTDLYFVLMAYDAFGSLQTDNIAYCSVSMEMNYRDP